MPRPVVALVGATASGKTGLSLDLAEQLGGEVVNTDAMQVYRGMDVGTAKLPSRSAAGSRTTCSTSTRCTAPATVARFQGWARDAIADIRGRDATPVLVGGSALYTRAILDRFEFPGTDESLRRELEAELERSAATRCTSGWPGSTPRRPPQILPDNGRRVVRALEVVALTGRPYSASLPRLEYADPLTVQVGVDIDRPTLDARIARRVEEMFAGGFVEEVEALLARGLADARTASRAIGYREVMGYLAGDRSLAEAIEQTTAATRRFARRQDSWFRKDPRIVWVAHDDPDRVEKAVGAVERLGG